MGIPNARRLVALLLGLIVVLEAAFVAAGPASADDSLPVAYDVNGSTYVGQGVNSTAKLGPAVLNTRIAPADGTFTSGSLPLPPTSISFKALGFIPLRSTVSFTQSGQITGQISANGSLPTVSSTAKYYIKLTNIQANVLGFWVDLGVGNNCRTTNPAVLNLATPKGKSFDVETGGQLTGKYTIGQFSNCAPLHLPDLFGAGSLAVNSLVPGSNNSATINLTNGRITSQ